MLKIAVCDDEKYYREQIHTQLLLYLKNCGLDASVDLFSSGKEFLADEKNLVGYDVVFLDINMEGRCSTHNCYK